MPPPPPPSKTGREGEGGVCVCVSVMKLWVSIHGGHLKFKRKSTNRSTATPPAEKERVGVYVSRTLKKRNQTYT